MLLFWLNSATGAHQRRCVLLHPPYATDVPTRKSPQFATRLRRICSARRLAPRRFCAPRLLPCCFETQRKRNGFGPNPLIFPWLCPRSPSVSSRRYQVEGSGLPARFLAQLISLYPSLGLWSELCYS